MNGRAALLAVLLGASIGGAWATPPGVQLARSAWEGKNFYLRGFWTGAAMRFDAAGRPLTKPTAGSWTMAAIRIEHIDAHDHGLRVRGVRILQLFDAQKKRFQGSPDSQLPVTLQIEANPDTLTAAGLAALQRALFLHDSTELANAVSPPWRPFFTHRFPSLGSGQAGGSSPVLRFQSEPGYPPATRKLCVQGQVLLGIVIGPQGTVVKAWIIRPLGAGLDEAGLDAVRFWKFVPARDASGTAVAAAAEVTISFRLGGCAGAAGILER